MKIVYIHDSIAHVGGVERIFAEKMNYLADVLGYEVYLITSIQGQHPFSFHISPKVKHIDLNVPVHSQYKYKYPLRLWKKWNLNNEFKRKLKNELNHIKPDIIIGTTKWKGDVICKSYDKAKIIIESHGPRNHTGINDGSNRNRFVNYFYRFMRYNAQRIMEKYSDVLVTLTTGDAKEWNSTKIRVIPNMTLQPYNTFHKSVAKKHVITVGRHEYAKGFDLLIKTWKVVEQKYPDWILDIYGEGSLTGLLTEQINDLKLTPKTLLHKPTPDIYDKYQESKFYVMSSRYEGWGLVLVEAMTCGIPCIAFDCPYGPSDIIEHEKNGLLVKNGDIQGLADAICWMIEHEEERKQMGIVAKETSKKYAPEVIMKQWDELFKNLVRQ